MNDLLATGEAAIDERNRDLEIAAKFLPRTRVCGLTLAGGGARDCLPRRYARGYFQCFFVGYGVDAHCGAYHALRIQEMNPAPSPALVPTLRLLATPDPALAAAFHSVTTRRQLARLLQYDLAKLIYYASRASSHLRYRTFEIPKRNGRARVIEAPSRKLRLIQQRLSQILYAVFTPRDAAHGFLRDRSIVTNAEKHERRRWVLNIDLENFFGSISFRRVLGLFMHPPFSFPRPVALLLAQITTFKGHVPQGAPTSPILSNMICMRLDRELLALARANRCTYTRYADDITFSTNRALFPDSIVIADETPTGTRLVLGEALVGTIENNGFTVQPKKILLRGKSSRQLVTGLVVNRKANLVREEIRSLRAMLHNWETNGLTATEDAFKTKYYETTALRPEVPPFAAHVRGKIDFLGMVRGQDDPLFLQLLAQFWKLNGGPEPRALANRRQELTALLEEYRKIEKDLDRQQAGVALEVIFQGLFRHAGLNPNEPFRCVGAQIDGSFECETRFFLLEAKWRKGRTSAAQIRDFRGKVRGATTWGLFWSISGYSKDAVEWLRRDSNHTLVLLDGGHLLDVLEGKLHFIDLMRVAIRRVAERGEPYEPSKRLDERPKKGTAKAKSKPVKKTVGKKRVRKKAAGTKSPKKKVP